MCRFTAYTGPEIPLERIVTLPCHSLVQQSQNATKAKFSVNGDGFGIAWYASEISEAGLYRDILPAWSDTNLTSLCRMVSSKLFLAHVRASTTGEISRSNCHPFTYDKWSFMHNGQIGGYGQIKRQLESHLPDALYNAKQGTTDSELFFYLLLANGLNENPIEAVQATLKLLQTIDRPTNQPDRITCAFSDGEKIYGFRYASDQKSPSLFIGDDLDSGGRVLASEPLDVTPNRWDDIANNQFVMLSDKDVAQTSLIV